MPLEAPVTTIIASSSFFPGIVPLSKSGVDLLLSLGPGWVQRKPRDDGAKIIHGDEVAPLRAARTMSSDGQWRYVSVRRLFSVVEQPIGKGTH